jgi:hypothetical protein
MIRDDQWNPPPVQWTHLPLRDLGVHRVGDSADQIGADVDVIDFGQVGLDVADGHALGVKAKDDLVDPVQPPLPLPHDLRLEAARPVPRGVQRHRPGLSQQRLGRGAVAAVSRPPTGRVTRLRTQWISQLLLQGRLED